MATPAQALKRQDKAPERNCISSPPSGVDSRTRRMIPSAGLPAGAARDEAARLLDEVRLAEAGGVRAGAYSGGMKRRLSVAIALLGDPQARLCLWWRWGGWVLRADHAGGREHPGMQSMTARPAAALLCVASLSEGPPASITHTNTHQSTPPHPQPNPPHPPCRSSIWTSPPPAWTPSAGKRAATSAPPRMPWGCSAQAPVQRPARRAPGREGLESDSRPGPRWSWWRDATAPAYSAPHCGMFHAPHPPPPIPLPQPPQAPPVGPGGPGQAGPRCGADHAQHGGGRHTGGQVRLRAGHAVVGSAALQAAWQCLRGGCFVLVSLAVSTMGEARA